MSKIKINKLNKLNELKNILKMLVGILGVMIFSDEALDKIKNLKINFGALFIITILILSVPKLPSSLEEIGIMSFFINLVINFIVVLVSITIMIGILYIVSKTLGSRVKFWIYFSNLIFLMLLISFLSFIAAFLLLNFGVMIGYPEVAFKLIQGSFIAYYFFVIFAWGAERFAEFDELKGVVVGVVALALNYLFHLGLSALP